MIDPRATAIALAVATSGCFGPTEVTGNDSCERAYHIDGDGGELEGSVSGTANNFTPVCHREDDGREAVFSIDIDQRSLLAVSASAEAVEVRAGDCSAGDYVVCAARPCGGIFGGCSPASAEEPVNPGRHYIHLDTAGTSGAYELSVDVAPQVQLDGAGTCDNPGVVTGSRRFFAGDSGASGHHATGSCGGSGAELVFRVDVDRPSQAFVRFVDLPSYRWRLYSRAGRCDGEEISCRLPSGAQDTGMAILGSGTNYVFVDTEIDDELPSSGPVEVIFEIDPI